MGNQNVKVIKNRTQNGQPLMNKLSKESRKNIKRVLQKRIRRASNKIDEEIQNG